MVAPVLDHGFTHGFTRVQSLKLDRRLYPCFSLLESSASKDGIFEMWDLLEGV